MRKPQPRFSWSFFAVASLSILSITVVGETKPRITWSKTFPLEGAMMVTPLALRYSPGDQSLVMAASRFSREEGESLVLWQLDLSGKVLWQRSVKPPPNSRVPKNDYEQSMLSQSEFGAGIGMEILPDGKIMIAAGFTMLDLSVVTLSPTGETLTTSTIPAQVFGVLMKSGKDTGRTFLAGAGFKRSDPPEDVNVYCWDVNQRNQLKALGNIDRGRDEFPTDALMLDSGNILLLLNSGTYNKFGGGPSEMCILELDKDGKVVQEKKFVGRSGKGISMESGQFMLTYDSLEQALAQEIWLVILDQRLEIVWRKKISEKSMGFGGFPIAQFGHEIVIVESTESAVRLRGFSPLGIETWTQTIGGKVEEGMLSVEEVLVAGDSLWVFGNQMSKPSKSKRMLGSPIVMSLKR